MLCFLIRILRCLLKPSGNEQPSSPPSSSAPQKVAILGGGVAGVAAAFWLTAPQQKNRYNVTLYTRSWRLGGKCASGRNAAQYDSIEEHGLHLLMGCYQNAFATIRACYDAWQRPATHPFKTWQDAFLPQRQITLMERDGVGAPPAWSGWNFPGFIPYPGEPGDPSPLSPVPFATALFAAEPPHAVPSSPHKTETPAPPSPATGPMSAQDANVRRMAERMKDVRVPPRAAPSYHKAIQALSDAIGSPIDRARVQALQAIQASQHDLVSLKLEDTLRTPNAPEAATALDSFAQSASRWVILANLGLAIGYGYLRDIFMQGEDAYDALNDQDFRAWLKTCLATDESLNSAPVRAIYDLAFAFRMGNASSLDNGSMAAGVYAPLRVGARLRIQGRAAVANGSRDGGHGIRAVLPSPACTRRIDPILPSRHGVAPDFRWLPGRGNRDFEAGCYRRRCDVPAADESWRSRLLAESTQLEPAPEWPTTKRAASRLLRIRASVRSRSAA